jgi:hypothetical protein
MIHQQHQYFVKQLNIENWPIEYVCEWIKGINNEYTKQFELNQIDGKKLAVIELTDLKDYLNINLKQQINVFKSIQTLLQLVNNLLI